MWPCLTCFRSSAYSGQIPLYVLQQEPSVVLNIREVQFFGVYTERLLCLWVRPGQIVCPGGQVDLGARDRSGRT